MLTVSGNGFERVVARQLADFAGENHLRRELVSQILLAKRQIDEIIAAAECDVDRAGCVLDIDRVCSAAGGDAHTRGFTIRILYGQVRVEACAD